MIGGNPALCAAMAARQHAPQVLVLKRAPESKRSGRTDETGSVCRRAGWCLAGRLYLRCDCRPCTMQVLRQGSAVYAGIGENLGEARAPAYLSTPHGRVALVACAATFQDDAPAGDARSDIHGRPGLNPLRHDTR